MITNTHCTNRQEHSRRNFLRQLAGVGAGALVLGNLPVHALTASPLLAALSEVPGDRVLVMLRLKGGNDGLNTFIPLHDFGTYQQARPDVHIPEANTVKLSGGLAMHPQLAKLESLWEAGAMRVVQNIGYPNQNLSHFRSADIHASTSDADEVVSSGLFGRYLEDVYPNFLSSPPKDPPAIQIGGPGNLLFNNSDDFNYAVSTSDPNQLYEIAKNGRLYSVDQLPDCTYGEQLGYLRAVANTTFTYAGVLAEAFDAGSNQGEYKDDRLGNQLSLVARLLKGGLSTQLFVVELDGFDTHANQVKQHAYLMESIGENVKAFYDDLAATSTDRRVLTMTFSEFGRRPEQNASMGTDHGAAAPMMLFGPGLGGNGMVGELPDLQDLDRAGNLKFGVDFRSVYATVLSRWLCIPDDTVDELIGSSMDRIAELNLSCGDTPPATTSTRASRRSSIGLSAYLSGGELIVSYELQQSAAVNLHFYNAAGQRLSTPFTGRQPAGEQQHRFGATAAGVSSGLYIVSVEAAGEVYSTKLALFR